MSDISNGFFSNLFSSGKNALASVGDMGGELLEAAPTFYGLAENFGLVDSPEEKIANAKLASIQAETNLEKLRSNSTKIIAVSAVAIVGLYLLTRK